MFLLFRSSFLWSVAMIIFVVLTFRRPGSVAIPLNSSTVVNSSISGGNTCLSGAQNNVIVAPNSARWQQQSTASPHLARNTPGRSTISGALRSTDHRMMLNSPQQTIDMSTLSSNSRTGAVYGGSTNVSANNSPLTRSATQQGNLLHSSSASPSATLNPDGSSQGFNRNNPTQQSLIGRISTTFKRR